MEASSVKIGRKAARKITLGGATLWEGGKYEVLEWLESDGDQWIDTGILATPDIEINMRFRSKDNSGNYALFGASNGPQFNNGEVSVFWYEDKLDCIYPASSTSSVNTGFNLTKYFYYLPDTEYEIEYTFDYFVANSQRCDWPAFKEYVPLRHLSLLGVNRGQTKYCSAIKLRGFAVKKQEALAQNLLPCRRLSDGILGMYDTVTKQFFTNQGSGTFVAGPATGTKI